MERLIEERAATERVGDGGAPVASAKAEGLSWLAVGSDDATERVGLGGDIEVDGSSGCTAPEMFANFTWSRMGFITSSTLSIADQNLPTAGANGSGRDERWGSDRSIDRH